MTLVRFGSIVQAASGKSGSVVFSSRKGAGTIQRAPRRCKSSTPAQLQAQNYLTAQQTAWKSLTYLHQLAWTNTARNMQRVNRLGVSSPFSGYTLFLKVTLAQNSAGLPPYTTCPPNRQVLQCTPVGVAFYVAVPAYYILIYPPTNYPTGYVFIQGCRTFSLTGTGLKYWHAVGTYYMASPGAIEIFDDWDASVGALDNGEWFGLRLTWHGTNAFPGSPLAFPRIASY